MKTERARAAWAILRGVLAAAGGTLVGMTLLATAVIYLQISDAAITAINQVLKVVCVLLGARVAVGVGGKRGFVTGACVGALYLAIGHGLYCALGGAFAAVTMLGEILLGAAIGAIAGAVLANLRPRARTRTTRM